MPDVCKKIIGYTKYPNEHLNLFTEGDYYNITAEIWHAAEQCEDTDEVIAGACHVVYPRCLMGYAVPLCRQACMGEYTEEPRKNGLLWQLLPSHTISTSATCEVTARM